MTFANTIRLDRSALGRALLSLLAATALATGCSSAGDDNGGDPPTSCGDGVCNEHPATCPEDCADDEVDAGPDVDARPIDARLPTCGDGVCEGNEPSSCPGDCTVCGNHLCELGEPSSCASDCVTCGNHVCESGEPSSCPSDCVTCGDHVCGSGEPSSCPSDCVVCGDHQCGFNEDSTCPSDCPATLRVSNTSSYAIFYLYVRTCASSAWGNDQLGASTIPIGSTFTLGNIPPGCYYFRAENSGHTIYWQTPSPVQLTPALTYTWNLHN